MGRATTIVGILLSVVTAYVAMNFNTIMDYIQAIFSWVNAPLFATMLLGMFWRRTTSAGAFWGLVGGMLTSFSIFLGFKLGWFGPDMARLLTFTDNPSDMARNLMQASWAWGVCFVLTVAISLVTKPRPSEELEGLVKGLTKVSKDTAVAWFGRPLVWAAIALAILVTLNLRFW
jgi:SSS family solute:Na+ symporter